MADQPQDRPEVEPGPDTGVGEGGAPPPERPSHTWSSTGHDTATTGGWDSSGFATTGGGGEDHPRTTIAFVLSLIALVFVVLLFWLIIPPLLALPMAIVGIVFGSQARRDMKAHPDRYRNEGLATAAVVLGWITLALLVLGILFLVLVIGIFSVSFGEMMNDPRFQQEILDQLERQSLGRPF